MSLDDVCMKRAGNLLVGLVTKLSVFQWQMVEGRKVYEYRMKDDRLDIHCECVTRHMYVCICGV